MATTVQPATTRQKRTGTVRPSKVDPATAKPFTLEQEIEPFGRWTSKPIWVPPQDASTLMAETMLQQSGLLDNREKSWQRVEEAHRSKFTQVREIELTKASIRLPQGKLYVSVTEQQHFDTIKDTIPDCVQTRLDEFLSGPGRRKGVKVYYLKPLCVEFGDDLYLTSHADLNKAIKKVQENVFAEYRRLYLLRRPKHIAIGAANLGLAIPRRVVNYYISRQQRAIDAYQAKLEFQRRKTAFRAARAHGKFRTDGCTFDEMLDLTNPLVRSDVIEQFGVEQDLSRAKRDQMIKMAAGTMPWFVSLALTAGWIAKIAITVSFAPPILVADPAFVAEMPGSDGEVLKIGHFDKVGGIMHVEI